jgi:hypothetical protein
VSKNYKNFITDYCRVYLSKEKPIHTLSMSMNGLNMAGVHGPPLAGLASLGLGPPLQQKDWDQLSMYSQKTERSVGRPRPYQPELRPGRSQKRFIYRFLTRHDFLPVWLVADK